MTDYSYKLLQAASRWSCAVRDPGLNLGRAHGHSMAAAASSSCAAASAAATAALRVVDGCEAGEASAIVAASAQPVLFRGMIERWPARRWAPEPLAAEYGEVGTLFRVHRRLGSGPAAEGGAAEVAAATATTGAAAAACAARADPRIVWEGDCSYCHATFAQFFSWSVGGGSDPAAAGALARYPAAEFFAYADYKYMHQLFADRPDALAAVDWAQSFAQPADGSDSTLWLGSRGACTQCHQDSYGANLVAQLHGTKRWTLCDTNFDWNGRLFNGKQDLTSATFMEIRSMTSLSGSFTFAIEIADTPFNN